MKWQSSSAFRKILIVQTAFIGDVLLITPLVKAVTKKYPSSCLDVMVIPACAEILENNIHIANVILFDKKHNDRGIFGFIHVLKKTRRRGYDLIIAPHRSLRTALLAFFTGAKVRIGFDNSAGGFLYNVKAEHRWGIHEIERNLGLISQPDGDAEPSPPQIFPDGRDEQTVAEVIKSHKLDLGEKPIAIAPGSVWQRTTKKSAMLPLVINVLVPLMTKESSCFKGNRQKTLPGVGPGISAGCHRSRRPAVLAAIDLAVSALPLPDFE